MRSLLPGVATALILAVGCSRSISEDDRHGLVDDFTLTERSGRSVCRDDLKGKVWLAACIFTRCTGACPIINGVMAQLHQEYAAEPDVVLVGISVDPEHDTPQVLREHADRYNADPNRWLFLTGPKDKIYQLIKDGFRLKLQETQGEARTPGNEFDHSPRLVVVDRHGHKRGFIDARDADVISQVRQLVTRLLRER